MACKNQSYCFITCAVLHTTKLSEFQVVESNDFFFALSFFCRLIKETPEKKLCHIHFKSLQGNIKEANNIHTE